MVTSNSPLAPDPDTNIDRPQLPDPPKQENLTQPVPLGESDDEGFVIHEEDREYPVPDTPKTR